VFYRSALLASVSSLFALAPAVAAAQDKYAVSAELRIENQGKLDLGSREIDIVIVYDDSDESRFVIAENPQSIPIIDAPKRQSIELRRLKYDDLVPVGRLRFTPRDPDFEEAWFNTAPGDNTVKYKVVLVPKIDRYKKDMETVASTPEYDHLTKLRLITEAELYLPIPPQDEAVSTVVNHYVDRAEILAAAYRAGALLHASASTSLLHDFEQKAKQLPEADQQRIFLEIGLAISAAPDLKANVGATEEQLFDVALRSFNRAEGYFKAGDSGQDAFRTTYHAAVRSADRAGEPLKALVVLDRMFSHPDLAQEKISDFTDVQRSLILESLALYGKIILDHTHDNSQGPFRPEEYIPQMSNECGGFNAAWRTYADLLLRYKSLGLRQGLEDSLALGQKIVGGSHGCS
jgi:hypothetical protein